MADDSTTSLHWGDYTIIGVYFGIVLIVGIWFSRSNRGSVKGYFLAGQNQHWIPVGASIFASNIGSEHFLGLAGGGAATGYSVAYYELHAVVIVLLLGWVFVPVYIASGVSTTPEYLRLRFGGQRIRIVLSLISLFAYIFTKISVDVYAGTVFIEQATKLNTYGSIAGIVGIAAIFTITGGLTAVIWTDFVQTILMILGAVALAFLSILKVGGFDEMVTKYYAAVPKSLLLSNSSCQMPREDATHIFRDPVTSDLPWPGALTGALIKSIWYWCTDQVIVQRALAAKNLSNAKAGTVLAGWLKMLPLFILVMPGMAARILYPETVGCADPETCMKVCGSEVGCSNIAYSSLVMDLMPAGARGLMLAVMLAALMSSLTSVFNSSSTIFTLDIWTSIRKQASSRELMVVGRISVIVLVALSVLWVPVLRGSDQLFVYIVEIGTYYQTPIVAVFVLAIFTNRVNEKGAFWGLLVGAAFGVSRFAVQVAYEKPTCENPEDKRPSFIKDFHFLYYAVFLFMLTSIVAIIISLLTKPIDKKHLVRLTFWTRYSRQDRTDLPGGDIEDKSEMNQSTVSISPEETGEPTKQGHRDEHLDDNSKEKDPSIPWYKKAALWICGIDHRVANIKSFTKHQAITAKDHEYLLETTTQKRVTNAAAIVLAMVAVFTLGFFS